MQKMKSSLIEDWNSKKPFKYLCFDDFFNLSKAEEILLKYPSIDSGAWDRTTYINQKNKFQKTRFEYGDIFDLVFKELNHPDFTSLLSSVTGIDNLIADPKLFGGGLHQSTKGAFLDIHVDYNFHPETKFHRVLNLLVYMNKDWKVDFEGHLELWDMKEKKRLEKISPSFNRVVIFETNEVSFHGHPVPLNTPNGITRKSLATYYYSKARAKDEITLEHNTKYVNIHGYKGAVKNVISGLKASLERLKIIK